MGRGVAVVEADSAGFSGICFTGKRVKQLTMTAGNRICSFSRDLQNSVQSISIAIVAASASDTQLSAAAHGFMIAMVRRVA